MKRLRNIEGKDEEQLKAIKEQGQKQLQILTKKTDQVDDFKNIFFRNELNSEAKRAYDEVEEHSKRFIIQDLSALAHQGIIAESLYNGSLSLKVAKLKQRYMEDTITRLEYYNPKKEKFKTQEMILIVFEHNVFPLPQKDVNVK